MSGTISRMMVEMGGNEVPLRMALQRARRDVEEFHTNAVRVMAKPISTTIDIDTSIAKRKVADVDEVLRRAYARWNKPVPATGPSALSMGLMGATGRYGNDDLPAEQIRRMAGGAGGRGNGIVTDMFGVQSRLATQSGEQMAKNLMAGLRKAYRAEMADAKEELFRGLINQQEFEQRGRQAAAAMNRGILSGIERIGDSGKMTGGLHAKLVGELNMTGLAAGEALTKSINRGMRSNAMYSAAVTAGFGIESILRAKDNTERAAAGVRTALQATASYAASAFGPAGLVVGAVAIGTQSIVDHFATTRQELKALREEWESEISKMVNAGDQLGLQSKLQAIDMGDASKGMGKGGGFKGGFLDMAATYQEAVTRMQEARNALGSSSGISILDVGGAMVEVRSPLRQALDAAEAEVERLRPEVERVQKQREELYERLLNPPTLPRTPTGLPAVQVTANAPGAVADLKAIALPAAIEAAIPSSGPGRNSWVPPRVMAQRHEINVRASEALGTRASDLPGLVAPSKLDLITADFRQMVADIKGSLVADFAEIPKAIGGTLMAAFGPVATVMQVLEPGIRALQPLFDAFIAPLAAVVEVVAVGLTPVFQLLFPVVRGVAWIFAFAYEVIARAVSGLARAIGNVVIGIGKLIDMLPFISGKPIIRAGESILRFADGVSASADQMRDTRKRLEKMGFGDTADSVNGLGKAAQDTAAMIANIPTVFELTLRQMEIATGRIGDLLTPTAGGIEMRKSSTGPFDEMFPELSPYASRSGTTVNVYIERGAVAVQGANKDPRAVAREVVQELERTASGFGVGTPWSVIPSTAI